MPQRKPLAEYLRDQRWRRYTDRNAFRDQSGPAISLVTGELIKRTPGPSEWEKLTRKDKSRRWAYGNKRTARPKTSERAGNA